MEKVMITKAQAGAIEAIKAAMASGDTGIFRSISSVIAFKMEGKLFGHDRYEANSMTKDAFITALTVGYEVEVVKLNPQQQLDELLRNLREAKKAADVESDVQQGIYTRAACGSSTETHARHYWKTQAAISRKLGEILSEVGAK